MASPAPEPLCLQGAARLRVRHSSALGDPESLQPPCPELCQPSLCQGCHTRVTSRSLGRGHPSDAADPSASRHLRCPRAGGVSRLSQHPAPISQAPPGYPHSPQGRAVAAPDGERFHQPGTATPNLELGVQTFHFLPRNSPNRAPRATSRNHVLILGGFTDGGGSPGGKVAAPKLELLIWSCPMWDSPSWELAGAAELCPP